MRYAEFMIDIHDYFKKKDIKNAIIVMDDNFFVQQEMSRLSSEMGQIFLGLR